VDIAHSEKAPFAYEEMLLQRVWWRHAGVQQLGYLRHGLRGLHHQGWPLQSVQPQVYTTSHHFGQCCGTITIFYGSGSDF
jgi:hypothetical protein